MKKTLAFLVISLVLPLPLLAAGKMSNISQEIDIEDATITATGGSNASAGAGFDVSVFGKSILGASAEVGAAKERGSVVIGNIAGTDGATMNNVSQNVNAKNAKITGDGGSVKLGSITASGGKLENIDQRVDAEQSEIQASGGGGASGSAQGHFLIWGGKVEAGGAVPPGSVSVGTIASDKAQMDNVSQTVNAKRAKITAHGGSVNVGSISAE